MKRAVAVFALVFTLFFGCQAPRQRRQFLRQKAGAVQVVNAAHFLAPPTNLPPLPAPARPAAELMAAATPLIAAGGLRFQLELTGIECQFCARAALELLERVPEVQSARYLPMPQSPAHKNSAPHPDQLTTNELVTLLDAAYRAANQPEQPLVPAGVVMPPGRPVQHNLGAARAKSAALNRFPGYVQLTCHRADCDPVLLQQQLQASLQAEGFGLVSFILLDPQSHHQH